MKNKIIGLALFQLLVLTSCKEEDLGASPQKITTVAGKTGDVVLTTADISGLLDGSSKIPVALLPAGTTGTLSGDVNGTTSASTVDKIKGVNVTLTSLATNDILKYNGTAFVNTPETVTTSVAMSGDITSASNTSVISRIKNILLTISSLTSGDVLQYNGTAWVNSQISYQQYAGEIMAFGGSACPTGWLAADGTVEANATEPQLFAAIGCNWGCPNGVSFNRPDLRGVFLRGKTSGSGRDPDVGSRPAMYTGGSTADNVGSYQDDAFQGHDHIGGFQGGSGSYGAVSSGGASGGNSGNAGFQLRTDTILSNGSYGTARVSTESRAKNVYVLYCVRRYNR